MYEYPSFKYQEKLRKLLSTWKHLYYQHNVTKLHYVNMTHHEYNIQEIASLLSFRRSGMINSEISLQEGVPLTTVRRLINKHLKDNGASFGAPTRRGLSSGLTQREKLAIIRNVRKNPKQTLAELCEYGTGVRSLTREQYTVYWTRSILAYILVLVHPCWLWNSVELGWPGQEIMPIGRSKIDAMSFGPMSQDDTSGFY